MNARINYRQVAPRRQLRSGRCRSLRAYVSGGTNADSSDPAARVSGDGCAYCVDMDWKDLPPAGE